MVKKHRRRRPYAPYWIGALFAMLAIITVPWSFYLGFQLPPYNVSSHWDIAWIGFDIGITAMLISTAILAVKRSKYLIIIASFTSSMLAVDAWFDVVTAHKGYDFIQSLTLAIFFEIPLAVVCMILAFSILENDFKN
jgi:hypothetical protein